MQNVTLDPMKFRWMLRLLDSPHCTIAYHVRVVFLDDPDNDWVEQELPAMAKLTQVKSLLLLALPWDDLGPDALPRTFPNVTHLRLEGTEFGSTDSVVHGLLSWPKLKNVAVGALLTPIRSPGTTFSTITPAGPPALRSLSLWFQSRGNSSVHSSRTLGSAAF
jgi:hypothetical protein